MPLVAVVVSGIPSEELFKVLASSGVITVPGGDFFVQSLPHESSVKRDPSIIRLAYAAASEAQINDGVERLAKGIIALIGAKK
jgi:DNA-binding transcriptional MocR family regulator